MRTAAEDERAPGRSHRPGRALRSRSPRLVFWLSWLVLTGLGSVWALANPMAAAPDEPAHIVRAASLYRGADLVELRPGLLVAEVPRIYALTHEMAGCYAFHSTEPASCWVPEWGDVTEVVQATTSAGNYNPLYYAIVGAPTLLEPRNGTLYLMRLVSAALGAFCIALGLRSVAEVSRRRWIVPAVALATTPMVVFMNSTVNPNAVEAAAGLGLWTTLLLALRHPDRTLTRRRWWRAGVLVVLLVNAKAFSPLYLAIIVLTAVLVVGWAPVRAALVDRRTWPGLALGVLGSAAAVAWTLTAEGVTTARTQAFPELTTERALNNVLRLTSSYVEQQFGRFGWHDTPAPGSVYLLLAAALGVVVVLSLGAARLREGAAFVALLLVVLLLPLVLQVPNASYVGLPWQGRYLMAVSVGVPVLAGFLLDRRAPVAAGVARRVSWVLLGVVAVTQLLSFWENLRRYVAGTSAPWFEPVENRWDPPLPESVLLGAALLAVLAWVVLLGWLAHEPDPDPRAEPELEPGGPSVPPRVSSGTLPDSAPQVRGAD
ncbi:DUF2142 domain-containing protein [Cellulomonas triticagri]|uniref:DUF2142 domain-containing protein n=1 Tax=Cellulomonas triticagri TaxID=2483352 RepID=A0A3M2JJJ6_9CELL|nr:DUF2142 domain-containing protein [Cellulomonas triticagri]RMI13284.1 DUF2142 domain-containing protein [Cellulomonas triticagri]